MITILSRKNASDASYKLYNEFLPEKNKKKEHKFEQNYAKNPCHLVSLQLKKGIEKNALTHFGFGFDVSNLETFQKNYWNPQWCCIFWPAFGCQAFQVMVQISFFPCFCKFLQDFDAKMMKNEAKSA